MPNWCDNTLIVIGAAKDIKRFDDKFKRPYESYNGATGRFDAEREKESDYNKYLEYKIVDNNITYISEIVQNTGYSLNNIIQQTKEDFLGGWYDWSIEHWGTKWDIDCVTESGIDLVDEAIASDEPDNEIEVVYGFSTAWGPCIAAVKAMAEQFPELKFVLEYEECGVQFAGKLTYINGFLTEKLEAEDEGYRRFLRDVLQHDYYEHSCPRCDYPLEEDEYYEDKECPKCKETIIPKEDE